MPVLVIFLGTVLSIYAEGYVHLANYLPGQLEEARFTPFHDPLLDSKYRARLVLMGSDGKNTEVAPSTSLRSGGYLIPLVVGIPGTEPGQQVRVKVAVYIGDKFFAETIPLEITLGTESAPALLKGLVLDWALTRFGEWVPKALGRDWTFAATRMRARMTSFLALDAQNRILVGGGGIEFGGVTEGSIFRFQEDGGLDPFFHSALAPAEEILVGLIQADGKILLGIRSMASGDQLVRLNVDGSIDDSFVRTTLPSAPRVMAILNNSNFLVATESASLRHYSADGTFLGTIANFTLASPANNTLSVNVIEPEESNGFYVGGAFRAVNGEAKTNLVRFLPNGNMDNTFDASALASGSGTVPDVADIERESSTNLLVTVESYGPLRRTKSLAVASDNRGAVARSSENSPGDLLLLSDGLVQFETEAGWFLLFLRQGDTRTFLDNKHTLRTANVSTNIYLLEQTGEGVQLARFTSAWQPWRTRLYRPEITPNGVILNFESDQRTPEFIVESSLDLVNWSTNLSNIRDSDIASPQKFYRLKKKDPQP